ncbi:hypothetical protein [Paenibacillus sp. UNC499MF]|uniref:hypothetical protein n=1 Tax=Paenibacillus sp. UNC499MF TaxID=1502751 RepID=UPI00089F9E86|nr:hypothetical protein [Paenibacillus sp. UNC499MF]SEG45254.1 hypothetical protein SAMN02799616_03034 [Paenibacillus sp. UNC499MF]
MRKKPVVVILLLGAAVYAAAFFKFFDREPMPSPPKAFIKDTGIEVPVRTVSYYWGLGKEGYGSPWVTVQDKEAVIVPKHSILTFSFEKEPKSIPQIRQVISDGENKSVEMKSPYEVVLPDKEGVYVYSVDADWKDGGVQYVVKVGVGSTP